MSKKVRVSIADLQLGASCAANICDEHGNVLLSGNVAVTEAFRQQLFAQGVTHLLLDAADRDALTGRSRGAPERQDGSPTGKADSRDEDSLGLAQQRIDRSREAYSAERTERFARQLESATQLITRIGARLDDLSPATVEQLCAIPQKLASMLVEDADQVLAVTGVSQPSSFATRSAQLSTLAMSTAMEMNLVDSDIALVGIAGLLHDLGLYKLPPHFRDPSAALTAEESDMYTTHPELTTHVIAGFPQVSEVARVLILQVHELPDGSGYPRGTRGHRFHPLTRILNVVESYLALIHPRPQRLAIHPHDALAYMLHQCRKGFFAPDVMRAFINQLTLFPIGSLVELEDGQRATVIRRDAAHYDQPVVRLQAGEQAKPIRLAQSRREIRAVVAAEGSTMRLRKEQFASLALDTLL